MNKNNNIKILALCGKIFASALPAVANNGTWNVDSDGDWNDVANWLGSTIAEGTGISALFTNELNSSRVVALSEDHEIGFITFTDGINADSDLTISGQNILTLSAVTMNAEGEQHAAYLPESLEFFSRASVTDENAKYDIDQFVRGCKNIGVWDKLVYVPCLGAYGGVHQLGGAAQRTNTPWSLVNAALTTQGVSVTKSGENNYLLSDVTINPSNEIPVTAGSLTYQNQTPQSVVGGNPLIKSLASDNIHVGMANYGNPGQWHLYYARNFNLLNPVALPANTEVTNNYRNSHLAAMCWDDSVNYTALVDNKLTTYTAGAPVIPTATRLRFFPPCNSGQNGVIQGAFLYYDNLTTLGGAVWRKFRTLVNQTILSRQSAFGNRRILISGQSNASGPLAVAFARRVVGESMGPSELFLTGTGGVPIEHWIGAFPDNLRTTAYQNQIWNEDETSQFQNTQLPTIGRKQNYIIWFQGESDTESAALSRNYRNQLNTFIRYVRENYGNDILVVVVQIDYNYTLRDNNSGGFHSNLTLTDFTGGLAALNGAFTITPLTSHSDPYVWTKAGFRVEQRSGVWVFVETAGNTVVASATTANVPHPAMSMGWVDASNNPVSPSFGDGNRTEWIERVRYAQQQIVNDLPGVSTFDSRGYARSDGVHIDLPALDGLATNLGNHLLGLSRATPTISVTQQSRALRITSSIGGESGLYKIGLGSLVLSGNNHYTGNTIVSQGSLAFIGGSQSSPITLYPGASLGFTLGSPTNSSSTFNLSSGTIKISGTPILPVYPLITSSTGIIGTPLLSETISGYTLHVHENTLHLVKVISYNEWASLHAVNSNPNDDDDGDGVNNLIEYVLGGDNDTNDHSKLPVLSTTDSVLIFSFKRQISSINSATVLTIEVDDDLMGWETKFPVPETPVVNNQGVTVTRDMISGYDTVKLTLSNSQNHKIFARLKVELMQ